MKLHMQITGEGCLPNTLSLQAEGALNAENQLQKKGAEVPRLTLDFLPPLLPEPAGFEWLCVLFSMSAIKE